VPVPDPGLMADPAAADAAADRSVGHQLQRESHLHVVPAPLVNEIHVRAIEEEHALQVSPRRDPCIPAVRSRLYLYRRTGCQRRQSGSL
jgi:hypothetical protein